MFYSLKSTVNKSYFLCLSIVFLTMSVGCKKESDVTARAGNTCYLEAIEKFKLTSKAFRVVEYDWNGENVYLMDSGESHYDGTSPIINRQCDTVCHFGGWTMEQCFKEMTNPVVLWQK